SWGPAGGGIRREKLPMMRGNRLLGIVLLLSSANGELVAIMNDGVLQRMRVGGASGVATKYLARRDAETVGLIGSGWQAGSQVMAGWETRGIKKIKVFSPNREKRDKFASEKRKTVGGENPAVKSIQEAVADVDSTIN